MTRSDLALLAGYLMVRMSISTLERSGKPFIQITVWDRSADRLDWACQQLQSLLPASLHNKPVKVVWVARRKQGQIYITGRRAEALLRKLESFREGTPLQHLLVRDG